MIEELIIGQDITDQHCIDCLFKGQEVPKPSELDSFKYYVLINPNTDHKILIKTNDKIARMIPFSTQCFGLKAKNKDINQLAYLDSLLDDSIELIAVQGKAGSGKTALALAGALELLLEKDKYDRLIIFKSCQTDKIEEIGFLPGGVDEKLKQAFFQIERFLTKYLKKDMYEQYKKTEIIQFQPMSQILGWDLENCIVILDEAQILDTNKIHQVLTRVGDKSKLIITGDPQQQFNQNLYGQSGFEYIFNNWDDPWFSKIKLERSYRSKVAQKAAEYVPDYMTGTTTFPQRY